MQLRTQPNNPRYDAKLTEPTVTTKKPCQNRQGISKINVAKISLYQDSDGEYTTIIKIHSTSVSSGEDNITLLKKRLFEIC